MEQKDKIISDYFAQLPIEPISGEFSAQLVELGKRTLKEREAVKADRGGIWIAITSAVVLIGILVGIFSYFGIDFAQMWGSIKVDRTPMSSEMFSSLMSWSILGVMALAMLIAYTLLIRRHTSVEK